MNNLYKVEDVVKDVLIRYPDTRSDNFILIFRVYQAVNENAVIRKPFYDVMLNHNVYGLPAFEGVVRARRKIFEKHPELKPEKITKFRNGKEIEYRNYSNS